MSTQQINDVLSGVLDFLKRIQAWEDPTDDRDGANWQVYQTGIEAITQFLATNPPAPSDEVRRLELRIVELTEHDKISRDFRDEAEKDVTRLRAALEEVRAYPRVLSAQVYRTIDAALATPTDTNPARGGTT